MMVSESGSPDDGADGTVWLIHTAVAGQCFQKELESFSWLQQLREIFVQIQDSQELNEFHYCDDW